MVDDFGGDSIAYQIGLVAGYSNYIGLDTRHHTAVVVLQNSFNWDYSLGPNLLVFLSRQQDEIMHAKSTQGHATNSAP